jgi:uncharacterized protein YjbI with pentapeptide repeats
MVVLVGIDPDLVTALAMIGQVFVAFLVAVATGIWAIRKWVEERRISQHQELASAAQRLEQQKTEEMHRREDRAAQLVLSLGEAKDSTSRMWTATALALYPRESLRLLINGLGHADDATAAAINLALASIGPSAITELVRMNLVSQNIVGTQASALTGNSSADSTGLAEEKALSGGAVKSTAASEAPCQDSVLGPSLPTGSADILGADRILRRTRAVIAYLILQCVPVELCQLDLAGVDLCGMNFSHTRLERVCLRKALLRGASFYRAKLNHANFRGADLAGTVLTRAHAPNADFTGARGPIRAIAMEASEACFQDARLDGSEFDGAALQGSSFLRTSLVSAKASGVDLSGTTIQSSRWVKLTAVKSSMRGATVTRVRFSQSNFSDAKWDHAQFERSDLRGLVAHRLHAPEARFADCTFNGAELLGANLAGCMFVNCDFSGARLGGARMERATFEDCRFVSTSLADARLAGTLFIGRNEVDAQKLDLGSANWNDARFEGQSEQLRVAFELAATSQPASSSLPHGSC